MIFRDRKLQKPSIVGNYAATLDCTTLEQLLEIKKSFGSLLNETFKSIEGSEET